ncbi:MAG TPA: HdeD family acid-resistance protein [Methylovirgula sp.]|nr:HdeD family acid-resistance protein [Methylovirgula sp.]
MSALPSGSPIASAFAKSVHDHWKAFLAEGILLVILGFGAIIVPPLAGIFATVFLGWLFLMAGVVGLVATFRERGAPGFWWSLLSATAALAAGILLLWNPLHGLATLTYVLIAFFIADGVLLIIMAIEHRRELSGRWEWMLFNGVLDIVLALVIISGLPHSLLWALGLLVGIDLVFGGASLIGMALDARRNGATLRQA